MTSGDVVSETPCVLCGAADVYQVTRLDERPAGETDFGIVPGQYQRSVFRCARCSVFFSVHDLFPPNMYRRQYNVAKYAQRMKETYLRIRNLPLARSDNKQRAGRIAAFLDQRWGERDDTWILDVGSGLCVFVGEMKDLGFKGFCIDPDPLAVEHARVTVGVDGAHVGTLEDFDAEREFRLISFNKVLEHVSDPIDQLARARKHLAPRGVVYVEVPDGERALSLGELRDREEFYIEHVTIFDGPSLRYLAAAAGLQCTVLESIHEPSDKCTLFAFMEPDR